MKYLDKQINYLKLIIIKRNWKQLHKLQKDKYTSELRAISSLQEKEGTYQDGATISC